jgi:tetratricopeptide (TPR) repeat protein
MNKILILTIACWLVILAGCSQESGEVAERQQAQVADDRPIEGRSFAGQPLYRNPVAPDRVAVLESQIAAFESKDELSEDEYIQLGRLYTAANRFRDTIDVYTRGLEDHPDSFKLRRHRGHRYINVRELDKAIVDLERALALIGDEHNDVLEYNAGGDATATYEHWVHYHIGLYHYLNGNWKEAAEAYRKCVDTATTNSVLVGATDWLYNAYQKGGMPEEAEAAIATIPVNFDTNQEHPYFKRVMVYKGQWKPEVLMDINKPAEDWNATDITVGYGVANWLRFRGDPDAAESIHRKILQTPYWNAWAYVVTDKEYEDR